MAPRRPGKRRRSAVELDPAEHRQNVAYGRRYREARASVLRRSPMCELRFEGCAGLATETDHVVEVARGGTSTLNNLRPVCHPCNVKKAQARKNGTSGSDMPPRTFTSPCPHRALDGTWSAEPLEPLVVRSAAG